MDGLGPYDDAVFRLLLDARRVPRQGGQPVVLVHWDYLPGAIQAGIGSLRAIGAHGDSAVFLGVPNPTQLARLRALRAQLRPLNQALRHDSPPAAFRALSAAWLRAPGHSDPWARTVAWEQWLHASLQDRHVDLGGVRAMLSEPLVSGWAPDVLAAELRVTDPALAARCAAKAVATDPRRARWTEVQRTARY